MINERYPVDHMVTKQDFDNCDWKSLLNETTRGGYPSMYTTFSVAAGQAIANEQLSHGKVLWLLADACSMMLSPKSFNEPFKPFIVMDGRRSAIPDDFLEVDIAFFAQIVDEIDNPLLKARLADLVWLKQQPRDVRFALAAIDAYRSIPLNTETWIRGGSDCWERAILLTRMLKGGAGERLKGLEESVLVAFDAATQNDDFLALWLANLLEENGLGGERLLAVGQKLEALAHEIDGKDDQNRARAYFAASAKWFGLAGDNARSIKMTVNVAETWVKEAVARISSDQPSYMIAASFYENAIQTYRTIPRSERPTHHVDERIVELHRLLNEAGEKSLDELSLIRTPGFDIAQMIENARSAVRGKSVVEALRGFANLHHGVKVAELRQNAVAGLREFPLRTIFPGTILSRHGRVIAKHPGMSSNGSVPEDDEIVIQVEMIRNFGILMNVTVQGSILPALEILLLEHRLREINFFELTNQSPIVPKGREGFFAKALFAGYDGDFAVALHILVPQIEHMVRYHLKQAGVKTTTLNGDGIENENGLSSLMESPEAAKVFGEDLAFEIRALFCDSRGSNLRNELAHGLADEEVCYSLPAIYAWWFGLRIIFNTFWNAAQQINNDVNTEDSNS